MLQITTKKKGEYHPLMNLYIVNLYVLCQMLWPPKQTADSLEKTLKLGKTGGKRRRGQQRTRWLDGVTDSMDMNLGKLWERGRAREAWRAAVHGHRVGCVEQLNTSLSCQLPPPEAGAVTW